MGTLSEYDSLTPKLALQLAAPHTWAASVLPPLASAGFATKFQSSLSITLLLALLVICILMQSAVNTLNDYSDFKSGADSADDNVEVTDATLVYNNINPKSVLLLALGFLFTALLLGAYCIYRSGWTCLIIGLIGALVIVLYSSGRKSISFLPIGELVSGFVMGGLIPLACVQVLTGSLHWIVLLWSIPLIVGIGLIMLTNNTCDIEKDKQAQRKTLSIVLGRSRSANLYRALIIFWVLCILILTAVFFQNGLIVLPFMLLASVPLFKALFSNPLSPKSRIAAMSQICSLNIVLGAFYCASIFASTVLLTI